MGISRIEDRLKELVMGVQEAQARFDAEWEKHKAQFEDQWFPGTRNLEFGIPLPERIANSDVPGMGEFLRTSAVINARDSLAQAKLRLAEYVVGYASVFYSIAESRTLQQ